MPIAAGVASTRWTSCWLLVVVGFTCSVSNFAGGVVGRGADDTNERDGDELKVSIVHRCPVFLYIPSTPT